MPDDAIKESLETLRFLYDKRLALFNTRREHEWKVFFAVITAIGALDAAIITKHVCFTTSQRIGWISILVVFNVACGTYEFEVQRRNRIDRIAMHQIQKALCDTVAKYLAGYDCVLHPADYHKDAPIEVKEFAEKKISSLHFLWAFIWQVIVLVFISLISIFFIPSIGCQKG